MTPEQAELLDRFDFYGNNGWGRNSQSERMLPALLRRAQEVGLSMDKIKAEMGAVGYDKSDLHQLDRWHSKVTTGRFGR